MVLYPASDAVSFAARFGGNGKVSGGRATCIGVDVLVITDEAVLTGDRTDLVGHEYGLPGCSGI